LVPSGASIAYYSFHDTATTELYTLSLHDALPIFHRALDEMRVRKDGRCEDRGESEAGIAADRPDGPPAQVRDRGGRRAGSGRGTDRKSTRLNSSHVKISYAVFCLKKKTTSSVLEL